MTRITKISLETVETGVGDRLFRYDAILLIIGDLHFYSDIKSDRDVLLAERIAKDEGVELVDNRFADEYKETPPDLSKYHSAYRIYAVNIKTKHHIMMDTMGDALRFSADPAWFTVETDDNGWIEWKEIGCPVPDGFPVEVMNSVGGFMRTEYPEEINWSSDNIKAYRPVA